MKRLLAVFCVFVLSLGLFMGAYAEECTGVINTEDVFFRAKPSTDAMFHERLSLGTQVIVTGSKNDFYAVTIGKTKGYVMKKFVTITSQGGTASGGKGTSYESAKTIAQLGEMPDSSTKGDIGDDVAKLQKALQIRGFYTGNIDGIYGENTWNSVKAFQKAVGLTATGKASKSTLVKLFDASLTTTATASAPKATTTSQTTSQTTGQSGSAAKLADIPVPAPCRKGDKGNDVKYVQQALKVRGFYNGAIDGVFGEDTEKAVMAFQKASSLSRDGVVGAVTIRTLFNLEGSAAQAVTKAAAATTSQKTYKTERLDWFNGGADVIKRGATFTVKDVKTGKTFKCKRWAGANHLDAEPLTASDTATMKAIYGGSWKWNRRAILVQYNGHVYAASMNGMPHGTTTIKNNNFDGHFCIHFYKSKTHESNKVDPDHQEAVATAMKYTW